MLPRVIRELVQAQLSELSGHEVEITGETLLIREGEYCGHRFQAGEYAAIWFLEEDEIKFYGPAEGVLLTIHASDAARDRQSSGAGHRSDAA